MLVGIGFKHLEGGGGSRVPNLKCLADAMELAYRCMRRYALQMMFAKEKAVALAEKLCDAADFASQCIKEVSDGNFFRSSEENY